MKKKSGFSLAEALITLLIVCIIAIMTAPIITKKTRKSPTDVLWTIDNKKAQAVIYPNAKRDIMLGDISKNAKQGIVVTGTMYFKDRNGNVIGWISEDGSNSFAQNSPAPTGGNFDYAAMMENQKKIMETLTLLSGMLQNESTGSNGSDRVHKNKPYTPRINGNNNAEQTMSEQELQKQIENIINSMNQNVYGK